jgi:hypothetical protein
VNSQYGTADPAKAKYARRSYPNRTGSVPDPPAPTAAPPGSPEKVAELERRAALGVALFHPADVTHRGYDRVCLGWNTTDPGDRWTRDEDAALARLLRAGWTYRRVGWFLGRTWRAVKGRGRTLRRAGKLSGVAQPTCPRRRAAAKVEVSA